MRLCSDILQQCHQQATGKPMPKIVTPARRPSHTACRGFAPPSSAAAVKLAIAAEKPESGVIAPKPESASSR